jgi:3-carboxy-cis,cis-muconate cycloisomerase
VNPFSAIFVPDELAAALSDRAWLTALLEAERALAAAQGADVSAVCDPDLYDVDGLAAAGRAGGNPVIPLVQAMRERAGDVVHRGATSQDIVDTAAMLVTRDALRVVRADVDVLALSCARLADEHRGTVTAARTLLQQAVPTTFGAKAAAWLVGVLDARDALASLELPAQLGGAAGTLAAFGDDGVGLVGRFASELGLAEPTVPWHAIRTPLARVAGALATTAGVAGKIAGDIVLLSQTEVAEVAEAEGGGSSTMPHKQNPTSAIVARACERHARANCGVLFESLGAEHERAAGAWHAEWAALTTALAATGGAVAAVARSLDGLRVDAGRMRANIDPATLSEAHRLGLDVARPDDYLGSVDTLIDRALARYRA